MTPPKPIKFENHISRRVMEVLFPDGYSITTPEDLAVLKEAWTVNLKSWHSPYTCLFDVRQFTVAAPMRSDFEKALKFFSNFFMRKIYGFCEETADPPTDFPFEVLAGYEQAAQKTGLGREGGLSRNLDDLRSRIQIDNDFNAHVMEVSFLAATHFETTADIDSLKSKMKNILMQWHAPYSVMFNCVNASFSPEAKAAFAKVERFLKGFFCKEVVGYAPKENKDTYPFTMYRARHQAAAALEHSGLASGAVANCSTRKPG